jgi:uncharacterized protein YbdZ (MbtH family)
VSQTAKNEEETIYSVVVNHEEQYSIWPADRKNAPGWRATGATGTREECLAHIKEVWTDMRPLSLREQMATAVQQPPFEGSSPSQDLPGPVEGDDLVKRLSAGKHPVAASLLRESSARALKERIELGYVHVKFTGTVGGTELSVRLDPNGLDLSGADFENQTGTVHLEGALTLNYTRVRCVADIDLGTLTGTGRLVSET